MRGRKSLNAKWRLGKDSEIALYAILLRLLDRDIEQRKDPQLRRSLNGVRRDWRQLHRRGTSDSSASDVKLEFEHEAGYRDVIRKIPDEREALQIAIEVAAAEPWLIDRVIAPRRRKEVKRAVKEAVIRDASRDFPSDEVPTDEIVSQLYPSVFQDPVGHTRRFGTLPVKGKLEVGGGMVIGAAIGAYTGQVAAPFFGQAIGGFMGLRAAAVRNTGMAVLGGGALAADSQGLAGGALLLSIRSSTESTGLVAYSQLDGVDIETEMKKSEILVRACCTSGDAGTQGTGHEMISAIDESIASHLSMEQEVLSQDDGSLKKDFDRELKLRVRLRKSLRDVKPFDKGIFTS